MRANLFIALLLVLITTAGCSKDHNSGPTNEEIYGKLLNNRTWSGDLKYTNGVLAEPFNITFNGDGTLTWREHGGVFKGSYTLDKNTGTIRFGYMDPTAVTAKISTDGKLSDFSYNQQNWILGDTRVNDKELELALEGIWKGDIRREDGYEEPFSIEFLSGSRVYIPPVLGFGGEQIYAREAGAIRFNYDQTLPLPPNAYRIISNYFFVITPDKRLAGLALVKYYKNGNLEIRNLQSYLLNKE